MRRIILRVFLSSFLWYIRRYFADGFQRLEISDEKRPIFDIYRLVGEDGYMEIDICFPLK